MEKIKLTFEEIVILRDYLRYEIFCVDSLKKEIHQILLNRGIIEEPYMIEELIYDFIVMLPMESFNLNDLIYFIESLDLDRLRKKENK